MATICKAGRWLPVVLILATAAGGLVVRAAQKEKADYKVVIYDDEHLKGRNVIIRKAVPDLKELKFSDKSESIEWHAEKGKAWAAFNDKNFQLPVLVMVGKGEVQDLGKEQRNALHRISSVSLMACPKGKYPKGISKDVPKVGEEE